MEKVSRKEREYQMRREDILKAAEKIFAQKIDKIIVDVIEKSVTSEIGKLKTILSEEINGEE